MKKTGHVEHVDITRNTQVGSANDNPYLSLHRLQVRNTYRDGTISEEYPYDAVLRKWLDAVTLVLTSTVNGVECVLLRSSVRPPLLLRRDLNLPLADERPVNFLWELPAGLIEDDDLGPQGIIRRACIEAFEETGYRIEPDEFSFLKGAPFVSPGVIPERIWFAIAKVRDSQNNIVPQGDGSPVEDNCEIEWVPVREALEMCDSGQIEDMKTELGIRRLAARMQRF